MSRLKWKYKRYIEFLKSYHFELGHVRGSHQFYNGRIYGEDRVVQVIVSEREKGCQSNKTIKMGIKHSGIPKNFFEEWDKAGVVHQEIIF
ncbi:hypothetical protein HY932_02355 [Candidatus Falkowbacteria bacterium]|nr:hypothetical protein [Candidatus Falkowbacteria bacterium]